MVVGHDEVVNGPKNWIVKYIMREINIYSFIIIVLVVLNFYDKVSNVTRSFFMIDT